MNLQMAKFVAIIIGLFLVDTSCYHSNFSTCFSRRSRRRRKVHIIGTIETRLGVSHPLNPTRSVIHPDNLGDFVAAYLYRKNQCILIISVCM